MGHKVGWLTLWAGIAGGADIILIPEVPYNIDSVINAIKGREAKGKKFTILAVAEGAISKEDAKLTKKEYKKKTAKSKYPSIAYSIADEISAKLGKEVRVTVPGHTQRGGKPDAYDRVLATRLGAKAGMSILAGEYGIMMGYVNQRIVKIPLDKVAGKLKKVPKNAKILDEVRALGISLGE